eukprot:SAG31_NODE_2124_length_6401_cov_2.039829_1_plen_26_part_10
MLIARAMHMSQFFQCLLSIKAYANAQ